MSNKQPVNDIMIAKVFSSDVNKEFINSTAFFTKSKVVLFFILALIWVALFICIKLFYEFNLYINIALALFMMFPIYNIFTYIYANISAKKNADFSVNKNNRGQYFFYRDRFIYSDNSSTTVIKYKHIKKAFENKLYFFIFVSNDKIYGVSKAGFMFPDEKDVLSKFLQTKLDKKYKKR